MPKSPTNPPSSPLTVEILRSLKFGLHLHLNGGSKFSTRVETNEEWGIAVSTETNGSPNYMITAKTIYMMADHDVRMDMLSKPWDLAAFVSAYNASRAKTA